MTNHPYADDPAKAQIRHSRILPEDIAVYAQGRTIHVPVLEPNLHIRAGFILRLDAGAPPRLSTVLSHHPTADLFHVFPESIPVMPPIPLLADPADNWLVCRATRYDITVARFENVREQRLDNARK